MPKRRVFLHLGPVLPGLADPHEALLHDRLLAAHGIAVPRVSAQRMHLADVEVRRAHREEGLRRKQVEGSWGEVCRQVFKARGDVLVSQPRFAEADAEQAALAADALAGTALHLLLTPPPGTTPDPDVIAPAWTPLVTKAHRVHVLGLRVGAGPADLARAATEVRRCDDERRRRRREGGLLRRFAA